jgi:hypothetical protein
MSRWQRRLARRSGFLGPKRPASPDPQAEKTEIRLICAIRPAGFSGFRRNRGPFSAFSVPEQANSV